MKKRSIRNLLWILAIFISILTIKMFDENEEALASGMVVGALDFENSQKGSWGGTSMNKLHIVDDNGNKVLKIITTSHDQYIYNTGFPKVTNGVVSFRIKTQVPNRYAFITRKDMSQVVELIETPNSGKWNIGCNGQYVPKYYNHIVPDQWTDVIIRFSHKTYSVTMDGTQIFSDVFNHVTVNEGYVGFKFLDGELHQEYYIDDMQLTDLDQESTGDFLPDLSTDNLELKLWYKKPAINWEEEALPIGNGHIGGMFFGDVRKEVIQVNENTIWDGGPNSDNYQPYNKEGMFSKVQQFRDYFFSGNKSLASNICNQLTGNEAAFGAYQNLGSFELDFSEDIPESKTITQYRRQLDLNNGTGKVYYTIDDVMYSREYFCSNPDDILVVHLTADQDNKLNFTLRAEIDDSPSQMSDKLGYTKSKEYNITSQDDLITAEGYVKGSDILFEVQYKVIADNAEIVANSDGTIDVTNAEDVIIIMAAATDYVNENHLFSSGTNPPDYKTGEDPGVQVTEMIANASAKNYTQLYNAHVNDYKTFFDRVKLDLGSTVSTLPTDELLEQYKATTNKDTYVEEMLFNYGRYLLISSSREGNLPANLQGLWNSSNKPPWNSDYHFNVNAQMNYWPANITNLSEMAKPFIEFVASLITPGRITAEKYHGVTGGGWVTHMKTNAFGYTAPGREFSWGWSPGSSAWACQNLWEYYEFTEDEEMLQDVIYPIMKEAALFWTKSLITPPGTDELVAAPSFSPEQGIRTVATTFDQEMIWQLFTDVIAASEVLEVDETFRNELITKRAKLNPLVIGDSGQIKEWREETIYGSIGDPHHRHISQLLGLYPGKHINYDTPELLNAAIVTLNGRGDGGTGWAKAHKINLWARTGDGEKTYNLLKGLLNSGIYSNLFDTHPPFQIDGNFGATSGIAEMLLQSHTGKIIPLPTLPSNWSNGSFDGLLARGNFQIGVKWSDSRLYHMTIKSVKGNRAKITYTDIASMVVRDNLGQVVEVIGTGSDYIEFDTLAGEIYTITMH